MKSVDSVKKVRAAKIVPLLAGLPARTAHRARRTFRFLVASKLIVVLMLSAFVLPLAAFEAHVINVTAKIERKPCVDFEIWNRSTWAGHQELFVLPQTVGSLTVSDPVIALSILNTNDTRFNRLRAQLLALKFNIAHFGAGEALVPGESITLNQLAAQADALLVQDPPATNPELETMKLRVERVNRARVVSTCPKCPPGMAMIESAFHYLNGSTTPLWNLWGQVNPGDHIRTVFTIAPNCEDVELSLISYMAPGPQFDYHAAGEQEVFDFDTGFFDAGEHQMEIDVPQCFFQVDFVKGPVIEHLGPPGSNNYYTAQGRLIHSDQGDPGAPSCENLLPAQEPRFFSSESLNFTLSAPSPTSTPSSTEGEVLGDATSTEPEAPTSTDNGTSTPQGGDPLVPPPSEETASSTLTSTGETSPDSSSTSTENLPQNPDPEDGSADPLVDESGESAGEADPMSASSTPPTDTGTPTNTSEESNNGL
jgi:hypothetical protein